MDWILAFLVLALCVTCAWLLARVRRLKYCLKWWRDEALKAHKELRK